MRRSSQVGGTIHPGCGRSERGPFGGFTGFDSRTPGCTANRSVCPGVLE